MSKGRNKVLEKWKKNSNSVFYEDYLKYSKPTCSHKMQEIVLGDGTAVYASAGREYLTYMDERKDIPTFGLYADHIWKPTWRNEFVDWLDFDIPTDLYTSVWQIIDAYDRARNGETVEVGCVGGHGRTGTILAVMMAASNVDISAKQAIAEVRKQYCEHAVETEKQEWYVAFATKLLDDEEIPHGV